MKAFGTNLDNLTNENENYRRVLWTGDLQLVVMSLKPKENIPLEIHPHTTQFIKVEKGRGIALIGNKTYTLSKGSCVIIPPNTPHEIKNVSNVRKLKLYTIYTPAEHKKGLVQRYKK